MSNTGHFLNQDSRCPTCANLLVPNGEAMKAPVTELECLRYGAQMYIDWYGLDTQPFVAKYGHDISTRTIGDIFRRVFNAE